MKLKIFQTALCTINTPECNLENDSESIGKGYYKSIMLIPTKIKAKITLIGEQV